MKTLRLITTLLLAWYSLPVPATGLDPMDERSMSSVTGREGIAMDMTLDGQMNKAEFEDSTGSSGGTGNGVFRIGNGNTITLGNGSGSPAELSGLTVDIDGGGSGNIVVNPPTGMMTVVLPGITAVTDYTSTTSSTYGDFAIQGLNPNPADDPDNTLKFYGDGEGLGIDFDMNTAFTIGTLQFTDNDGNGNGAGTLSFDSVKLQDNEGTGWLFEGLELDADYYDGLVVSMANEGTDSMNDIGLDSTLSVNETPLFDFIVGSYTGIEANGTQLHLEGNGDGLIVTPVVNVDDIDDIYLKDGDGIDGTTSSSLGFTNVELGDIFGVSGVNSADLGEHTINVDGTDGIVINAPDRGTTITKLDVAIGDIDIGGGATFELDFSNLDWRDSSLAIKPGGTNDHGFTIDTELDLRINEIRLIDSGYYDAGFISIGETGAGEGLTINDGSGNPASLTGLTVDVDGSDGVVVAAPDGSVGINATNVHVGDASTSLGKFDANNFNVQGSKLHVQPHW